MDYKFIFGPSRSGTTLLAARLGQYRGSLVPPELQFIYNLISDPDLASAGRISFAAAISKLERDYSFCNLKMTAEAIKDAQTLFQDADDQDISGFVASVILSYGRSNGIEGDITSVIEHSPVARRHIVHLNRLFKNSLFVGVYRDPRAVFASLKKLPWGPNTAAYFAVWWKNALLETLSAKTRMPEKVRIVSYENLIRNTAVTLDGVAEFLQLSKPTSAHDQGRNLSKTKYNELQHSLVDRPIDSSRIDAWKSELTETEIAIIEHHCGQTMKLLGYELSGNVKYSRVQYYLNIAFEKPLFMVGSRKQRRRRLEIVKTANSTASDKD